MKQNLGHRIALVVGLFLVSAICVYFFPMMTDEAYYMDWARRSTFPDLGFFDHPPFVSWQGFLARFQNEIYMARIGVLVTSAFTFYVNWHTALKLWRRSSAAWIAAVTAQATIAGLANSFLLTPDSGLALWWSIAIHEGLVALQGHDKRWLTAGLATGAGLMSKYTMVLIGPLFLIGLIFENRKQLRSPWPYLGGVLAVLVFAPNLYWNAEHQWTTLRFQFGHGFSVKQSMTTSSGLPDAESSPEGAPTYALFQGMQTSMGSVAGFEETRPKVRVEKSRTERAWQYMGDYLGGVVGLWGFFVFVVLGMTFQTWRFRRTVAPTGHPCGFRFIQSAAIGPVLFFFLLSPFSKIEANWPAMHIAPAAVLLAGFWQPSIRRLAAFYAVHAIVAFAFIFMTLYPAYVPYARQNRILTEASGYDELVTLIKGRLTSTTLAVDSYQLKSAFAARAPNLLVSQWPRITRPSEYTRGAPDDLRANEALLKESMIQLLTFEEIPPQLPGYFPVTLEGIRSCPDGKIAFYGVNNPVLPCEKGLRDWWLVTYKKT